MDQAGQLGFPIGNDDPFWPRQRAKPQHRGPTREPDTVKPHGEVARHNRAMLRLAATLGFAVQPRPDDPELIRVCLALHPDIPEEPEP